MLLKLTTSTLAIFFNPGTEATKSSPLTAGTAPPVLGSIFMAMVPPVATTTTLGSFFAKASERVENVSVGIKKKLSNKTNPILNLLFLLNFFMICPPFSPKPGP